MLCVPLLLLIVTFVKPKDIRTLCARETERAIRTNSKNCAHERVVDLEFERVVVMVATKKEDDEKQENGKVYQKIICTQFAFSR